MNHQKNSSGGRQSNGKISVFRIRMIVIEETDSVGITENGLRFGEADLVFSFVCRRFCFIPFKDKIKVRIQSIITFSISG